MHMKHTQIKIIICNILKRIFVAHPKLHRDYAY